MNKDCFAYSNGGCGALNSTICQKKPCSFYKTHQRQRLEKRKAYDRLMDLGRIDLIDTYKVAKE